MKQLLLSLLIFGFGISGSLGQTIKSLGYNVSNNQVVFAPTNTNSLTFLKNIQIKGSDTTNIPTLFWQTSDGVGDGSMLAFSRRHATNLWFGINQTNWSQGVWGQNIQPTADGNNFTRKNTNFGSVALVLENEYNAEQNTNNPSRTVAEMYFDIIDTSGQRTRPLMFVGSQTNSALGWGYSVYPLTIGVTNLGWNAASALMVEFNNAGGGGTAVIKNMATNGGSYAELQFVNSANSTIFYAKQNKFEIYGNHSPSYHILQAVTNGVIIGGSFSSSAAERVQLGGNTRIDGAISFNATSNAATTRTNLGLGLPALTNTSNVTFLSAVGAPQTIFSVRTNDLSITNETNATSTGLSFNTEPNARYVVTLYPIVFGNTDVQMVASNSTIFGQWNGLATGFASATELTDTRTFSAGSDNRGALQTFYVEGGTNAGSISMTFRSGAATNTNTIKAGSFIRADRMP